MSQLTEQMAKLLQSESLSHSLSKESLQSMLNEIRTLNGLIAGLESDLKKCKTNYLEEQEKLKSAREANSILITENINYKKREKELLARELICTKSEIRNEFEKIRGDEHYHMLNKIFDNRVVRENITRTYPLKETFTQDTTNGITGYSSETHVDATETKTTETKEE